MQAALFSLIFALKLLFPAQLQAATQNYVMPVIPVRTPALWREGADIRHLYQMRDVATHSGLPITWLLHYDILKDPQMVSFFKNLPQNHELGIFLEVTTRLAQDSKVYFDWQNGPWSSPHKLYLQGYTLKDRTELLNTFFNSFKGSFGEYPKSYGSWYIDGFSGNYIKNNFGSKMQLGLADQYSTDGYQVWGQHLNNAYYQDDLSVIEPTATAGDHILKVLWAPREPTLSFGESVEFSNFSLQANDYFRSKSLPHSYFQKALKTMTTDTISPVTGIVVGLEVGEVKSIYLEEFARQLQTLKTLQSDNFHISTMSQFENYYRPTFSTTPPAYIPSTQDNASSYWYQTPHYRVGLFRQNNQLILKDLRFYHGNNLSDNDQSQKDASYNLARVVPALVDAVSFQNSFVLGQSPSDPVVTSPDHNNFQIKFDDLYVNYTDKTIILSPLSQIPDDLKSQPFSKIENDSLILQAIPTQTPVRPICATNHGYPQGRLPCAKLAVQKLLSPLPTILYSNLSGTRFIGVKTARDQIFAFTFPKFSLQTYNFDAQVLSSFINITAKFQPRFNWYGRQEDEVPKDLTDKKVSKIFTVYGQEHILDLIHKPKLFENGYYFVPKP